jgi:hypothetical protein
VTDVVDLLPRLDDGGGLFPLMRNEALIAWVSSLDEARARAEEIGARLRVSAAALEQLQARAAAPLDLPEDVELVP